MSSLAHHSISRGLTLQTIVNWSLFSCDLTSENRSIFIFIQLRSSSRFCQMVAWRSSTVWHLNPHPSVPTHCPVLTFCMGFMSSFRLELWSFLGESVSSVSSTGDGLFSRLNPPLECTITWLTGTCYGIGWVKLTLKKKTYIFFLICCFLIKLQMTPYFMN